MAEKSLLEKAKMPVGKRTKEKLDEWINKNINVPLHEKGFSDAGAALSAALSAGGELLIPDDLADAAMAAVPGASLIKAGKKGMKALKQIPTIDYGAIKKAEKAKRQASEKMADTLEWKPSGAVIRKKPNLRPKKAEEPKKVDGSEAQKEKTS